MVQRCDEARQHPKRVRLLAALSAVIAFCVSSAEAAGAPAQARVASDVLLPTVASPSVGDLSAWVGAGRNSVGEYPLPFAGTVSELGVYLAATLTSHPARSDRRDGRD